MPWLAGALSDASSSKYRRRFWILLSTIALVISTFTLAYCRELASFFVDLFGAHGGDWTERRAQLVSEIMFAAIAIAEYHQTRRHGQPLVLPLSRSIS